MPTKHEITVSEEVLGVLRDSAITPDGLHLPQSLDRALYAKIAKPLTLLGISWDRGAKCHLFAPGAYDKLQTILGGGTVIDTKKALQQFFTPPEIAEIAVTALNGSTDDLCGADVLEPSAGHGALAKAAFNRGGDPTCVEVDPECCKELRKQGLDTYGGDFTTLPANFFKQKFDYVAMNPPFTQGQDVKHVLHALKFLKRGGVLVSIVSPAFRFRDTAIYSEFRNVFEGLGGRVVQDIPSGAFRESGTDVTTVLIRIET